MLMRDVLLAVGVKTASLYFFQSKRRNTRCGRDWSSAVCSSDLSPETRRGAGLAACLGAAAAFKADLGCASAPRQLSAWNYNRSEERRVGKECRARVSAYH